MEYNAINYTQTEKALIILAKTFYEYAAKEQNGHSEELERGEMTELLQTELKNFAANSGTFEEFDKDKSGSVNFGEFMRHMADVSEKYKSAIMAKAVDN